MLDVGGDMSKTALVIMARAPQLGKIKTRLAATIGSEVTLRLYQAFLTDLARRFADQPYALHWAYTPAEADFLATITQLAPHLPPCATFRQAGPDLGSRLHHAFRTTQALAFQKTILIGSDAPQISREIIIQAERALDKADVVLGPADDGGYYLIAMRAPHDLFSDIPMSTFHVLQMTIERAAALKLAVYLLEPLFDIDDESTLARLARLLQTQPALAPATAVCLKSLTWLSKELV
jgi:uncharacterized protein